MKHLSLAFAGALGVLAALTLVFFVPALASIPDQTVNPTNASAATLTEGNWQIEVIDQVGLSELSSSALAIDPEGNVHVAYDAHSDHLRYASMTAGDVVTDTIDTLGLAPSIVLDSLEKPHIAWTHREPAVYYAHLDGGVWVTDTVAQFATFGVSLVLDSNDIPHASYWKSGPFFLGGGLRYAYWDGAGWQSSLIEEIEIGSKTSMAFDSNEFPHVAYVAVNETQLRYANKTSGNWVAQLVDEHVNSVSMVLDANDVPHIAYTRPAITDVYTSVLYATWDGGSWITETVDSGPAEDPSIAVDRFGTPHLAYCDARQAPPDGDGQGLKYAYLSPDGWVMRAFEAATCSGASLVLDAVGNPHISYQDISHQQLKYVYWDVNPSEAVIPVEGGALVSADGSTNIEVPAGAFTGTVSMSFTPLAGGSLPPGLPGETLGSAFDLSAVYTDSSGTPAQLAPGGSYTLTLTYSDTERDVLMEDSLAFYYWDGETWVVEPTSQVDALNNQVIATPDHFSVWALLGETNPIYLPLVLQNPGAKIEQ